MLLPAADAPPIGLVLSQGCGFVLFLVWFARNSHQGVGCLAQPGVSSVLRYTSLTNAGGSSQVVCLHGYGTAWGRAAACCSTLIGVWFVFGLCLGLGLWALAHAFAAWAGLSGVPWHMLFVCSVCGSHCGRYAAWVLLQYCCTVCCLGCSSHCGRHAAWVLLQ